jgi:hypothetical protein
MPPFVLALALTSLFTAGVGIAALVLLSWDAPGHSAPSATAASPATPTNSLPYPVVRHINTDTIETVNDDGQVQRWTRS